MQDRPAAPTDRPDGRLELDPLSDDGAAELRRRIRDAEVRRVPRAELDGHVGLSSRALYELGATVAPIGLRGVPSAVVGRLVVIAGVLFAGAMLGLALAPIVGAVLGLLDEDLLGDRQDGIEEGLALSVFFGLAGAGGLVVVRRGVALLRRGRAARRETVGAGTDPALDPQARATVAVVREPDAVRVALLWLRGDSRDAEVLESRSIAELRVDAEDPLAAEDAVERLSEVVLRADAARGLPAPRADDDERRRVRRAGLVAAAGEPRPAVDPRRPVRGSWDPEPLSEVGGAELAARLVHARPLLWNAEELERVAVDPRDPLGHRPPRWPTESRRRAPLRSVPDRSTRRWILGAAWTATATWVVAAGSLGRATASEVGGRRTAAYAGLAVAVVLFVGLRYVQRTAPGRRLLGRIRRAARTPSAALERGVPGPAGRVLVLHGTTEGGADRLELVHVRPEPGDGAAGRLQVRVLAWREEDPDPAVDVREAVQHWWRIADEAGFVTDRRGADAAGVQRLNRGLARATETRTPTGLTREPLAWGAATFVLVLAVMVAGLFVGDDPFEHGGGIALAVVTWPLVTVVLFWRAARRVLDPVD